MRLLKLVPDHTTIDFIGKRFAAFAITILVMLIGIGAVATKGLNFGIDFKGGILIDATYAANPVDVADLRARLGTLNLGEVALQTFGDDHTIMMRVQRQDGGDEANTSAVESIKTMLGEGWTYNRSESVGPTVGNELLRMGLMANLLAIVGIGIYVAFRFEWQFGVAAMTMIFHDVLVSLGLIAALGLEFNLTSVAALLLLAGKSVNDTVIVFDRIRENLRRYKQMPLAEIINLSVNSTLSRTILTSVTVMLAILPMLFLGGAALFSFNIVIAWGIFIGTFSSIYVASSILIYLPPLRMGKNEDDKATRPATAGAGQ